jgi:hypothetical protein
MITTTIAWAVIWLSPAPIQVGPAYPSKAVCEGVLAKAKLDARAFCSEILVVIVPNFK